MKTSKVCGTEFRDMTDSLDFEAAMKAFEKGEFMPGQGVHFGMQLVTFMLNGLNLDPSHVQQVVREAGEFLANTTIISIGDDAPATTTTEVGQA